MGQLILIILMKLKLSLHNSHLILDFLNIEG